MSFFTELKRRNVIRMAGLYLVGAWLFIQVAETLLPIFGTPEWVLKALVMLLALGFVPAVVFSWLFELTPEGLKRDADVNPDATLSASTGRRMDRLILMGLALVIIVFAADRYWPKPEAESTSASPVQAAAPINADKQSTETAPAAEFVPPKSIAVLAFTDLSPKHDQDYFSDGIAEELLNALAQVKDLKVAGRTSSFYYKGRNEDLRSIGKALGVANVLEGSVRTQGDKVRITAQLVRSEDGFHLWSETYDGDLKDVFALQERIARSITDKLKIVLDDKQAERLVNAGTANPEAYSLYLQATSIFNRRDAAHYADAISDLHKAVGLDPNFARAYSRLATMYALLANTSDESLKSLLDKVAINAQKASALDPDLAEPYAALGLARSWLPGEMVEQRQLYERALALDGDDVTTNFWYGLTMLRRGYLERGVALIERALEKDPMLPNALRWRGIMYFYAGDTAKAEQLLKQSRDLGLAYAERNLADIANARGDKSAAIRMFVNGSASVLPDMPAGSDVVLAEGIYGDSAARARALALLDDFLLEPHEHIPGMIAVSLFLLDEPARALNVQHTRLTRDSNDFLALLWSPQGKVMRELPEFQPFLRDSGLVDFWDRYGPPDLCKKTDKGDYVCE